MGIAMRGGYTRVALAVRVGTREPRSARWACVTGRHSSGESAGVVRADPGRSSPVLPEVGVEVGSFLGASNRSIRSPETVPGCAYGWGESRNASEFERDEASFWIA